MALRNKVCQKNNSRKFSSSRRRMTYFLWIIKPHQDRESDAAELANAQTKSASFFKA